MSYLPQFPFARRSTCVSLLLLLMTGAGAAVRAQTPPPPDAPPAPSPTAQTPAEPAKPQAPAANDNAELSSRDTAPTFKVRVNLVLVRVVVRDQQGKVVPNLRKEDFVLSDNRKPQVISTFSVETPESRVVATTTSADPNASADPEAAAAAPPIGSTRPAAARFRCSACRRARDKARRWEWCGWRHRGRRSRRAHRAQP